MIINNSITPPTAPPIIALLSELLPLSSDTGVSNKTTLSYAHALGLHLSTSLYLVKQLHDLLMFISKICIIATMYIISGVLSNHANLTLNALCLYLTRMIWLCLHIICYTYLVGII